MVGVATYQPSTPYTSVKNNTASQWWRDPSLRRNVLAVLVLYMGSFSIGYDGSYLNALQSMSTWNAYFDHPSGTRLSIISATPYLVMIATSPFQGWLQDRLGRRPTCALAAISILVGALVGAFAKSEAELLVGRALAGPGGSLAISSSSVLAGEILHPRLRAVGTSGVMTTFFVGSAVAAWVGFGVVAADWTSSWSWRLPTLLQIIGPVVVLAGLPLVPESPRWLIAHGKRDVAHKMLARHHANGDMSDPLVLFELSEIEEALEHEKTARVGFRTALRGSGNRKRLAVVLLIATGSQLTGTGIFSYYLSPVLNQVGVTSSLQQTAINGGLSAWNLLWAILGTAVCEKWGRRPLWIVSTLGVLGCFVVLIGLSGSYASTGNSATGLASVAFMFLAYAFYDIAWTPLSFSYPCELLPYSMRSSVMSLFAWTQWVALAFTQWVNPVGLQKAQWCWYFLYLGFLIFYSVCVVLLFPETKGKSLEEVALIFDDTAEKQSRDLDHVEEASIGKEIAAVQVNGAGSD